MHQFGASELEQALCYHGCDQPRMVATMCRLVILLLAFQPVAAVWAAECDNVARLSDLNGEIYAVGGANASQPCGWRICPDRRLQRMEFWANESRFQGSDQLAFYSYSSSWRRRCDDRDLPDAMIGIFSVTQPVPGEMELRGAADMFLVRSSAVLARGAPQGGPLGAKGEPSAPG